MKLHMQRNVLDSFIMVTYYKENNEMINIYTYKIYKNTAIGESSRGVSRESDAVRRLP